MTLYIAADVLLGLLTDQDFTLLALPSDQLWLPQVATGLVWTIKCWTLCWVYACNEGISTELELWLCSKVEESTMDGGLWDGWGESQYL